MRYEDAGPFHLEVDLEVELGLRREVWHNRVWWSWPERDPDSANPKL